jgi:basic membrane lipoprotein Med (substrate-binding protein (PBP1-ABC) superfamily)
MTSLALHRSGRAPQAARRADPLVAAFIAAVVAGVVALLVAVAVAAPSSGAAGGSQQALVVVADGRPAAALDRARVAAARGAAVRVPRTPAELAVDLRYLAAAGYDRVVVDGPGGAAAVREVAPAYPRVRFVVR